MGRISTGNNSIVFMCKVLVMHRGLAAMYLQWGRSKMMLCFAAHKPA